MLASGQDRLNAIAESRAYEIRARLRAVVTDLGAKANNPVILDAGRALVTSWRLHGPGVETELRRAYQAGADAGFDPAGAPGELPAYALVHRRYHPFFRAHARAQGYSDLFLISPDGVVVYSVRKGSEFT